MNSTCRPEWVVEAHNLGMKVNVWTVDEDDDIKRMLLLGVDEVTTNMPEQAMRIIESGDFGEIKPY